MKKDTQQKALNAKKLDVDFGGDDFFDSFGMANVEPKNDNQASTTNDNPFSVAEKQNNESGPFQLGSGVNTNSKQANDNNDEFIK